MRRSTSRGWATNACSTTHPMPSSASPKAALPAASDRPGHETGRVRIEQRTLQRILELAQRQALLHQHLEARQRDRGVLELDRDDRRAVELARPVRTLDLATAAVGAVLQPVRG